MNRLPTPRAMIARCLVFVVLAGTPCLTVFAADPLPLHARIDAILEAPPAPPLAPLCTDGEFLRRVSLDLTGAIPEAAAARAFLADPDPQKRAKLIDQLLASPAFARHLARSFDVTLMERRPAKAVKQEEWEQYLYAGFLQNKPWDQLAREILGADGSEEKIRAASRFYLDRDGEPNALTRDVGRIFFGMDFACCQCHDHPQVNQYLQSDYHGLFAFLSRGTVFTDKEKKVFYAEQPAGEVKFTSVFTKEQDDTRPCLPGGFEIEEPVLLAGEEYTVAPADGVRPIPKYSRRAVLASSATTGTNEAFNRNIANRLWAHLLGRGLVEPLDMHHRDNPPTRPELLEVLTAEIVALKFDMRAFLREVALTRAYQRSVSPPTDPLPVIAAARAEFAAAQQTAEAVTPVVQAAAEPVKSLRAPYDATRKAITALVAEWATANGALGSAQKAVADTQKALAEAQQQLTVKQQTAAALAEAATKAAEAAAKLAGDAELAGAVQTFQTRSAQLQEQVQAADKVVQERTPPATAAAAALTTAQTTSQQLVAKLQESQAAQRAARESLAAAHAQHQQRLAEATVAKARLKRLEQLDALGKTLEAHTALQQSHASLAAEIAAAKETLAKLTAEMPGLEKAMTDAKAAQEIAAQQLAEAQQRLTEKQQLAQAMTDAATTAEAALAKLPEDAELKKAVEIVKGRRDQAAIAVTEMSKPIPALDEAARTTASQSTAAQQSYAAAQTQMAALQQTLPEKETQLPALESQRVAAATTAETALQDATTEWSRQFSVGNLEPLTPEQMALSILAASGVAGQTRTAAETEIFAAIPLDPNQPADPAKLRERELKVAQKVHEQLQGHVNTFVGLFGHAAGQPQRDFFATVDQALYFANAGVLQSWLNPSGENLVGRLLKLSEPAPVAEELYLSILTRAPTAAEVTAVSEYLQARPDDRPVALQELAWALITSTEFRFCP